MFLNKNISQGEDILCVSLHTASSHLYFSLFFNVSWGPVMCLPDRVSGCLPKECRPVKKHLENPVSSYDSQTHTKKLIALHRPNSISKRSRSLAPPLHLASPDSHFSDGWKTSDCPA